MPACLARDLPMRAEKRVGDDGEKVGVVCGGADIESAQGQAPDLRPAIREKGVHPQPDKGPGPKGVGLLEIQQPIPETQKQEG